MADLTERTTARGDRRDRGQILLVAALALGVTFVALALVLNSAIFTENLASRGETTGGEDLIEYRDEVRRGVGEALDAENRLATESDVHSDVRSRLNTSNETLNAVMTRTYAKTGISSNVNVTDWTNGRRISQSDSSRLYRDENDDSTWKLASSVDNTRAFRLDINRSKLSSACTLLSSCFNVSISNGADHWNVSAEDTASGIEIGVEDGGTTATCDPISGPTVEVDLTAGTINGTNCPALSFADAPSSNYDITFHNGDKAGGTYELTVENPSIPTNTYATGGDPQETEALYDVTVAFDYESTDVDVETEVRVAPGEPDG